MSDSTNTETVDTTPPGAQDPSEPTQAPEQNKGSGQFAVWNVDLGQFVSGVGDKATATQMRKDLGKAAHNGTPQHGHKLELREV
jgi:hypothetical protein